MVWIEIFGQFISVYVDLVTTFAVVWIEITHTFNIYEAYKVTTFAVVWIEIRTSAILSSAEQGHHLRGGVD